MPFELLGFKSLGEIVPLAASATAAVDATVALTLPELQAKLAGLLSLQASLTLTPPSIATSLTAALALVASLEASIALGLPSASLDLSAVFAVVAELELLIGAINVQLNIALDIDLVLGSPGVALYRYSGDLDPIASQLQGGNPFPGVAPLPLGVFIVAQDLGAVDAMRQLFGI